MAIPIFSVTLVKLLRIRFSRIMSMHIDTAKSMTKVFLCLTTRLTTPYKTPFFKDEVSTFLMDKSQEYDWFVSLYVDQNIIPANIEPYIPASCRRKPLQQSFLRCIDESNSAV